MSNVITLTSTRRPGCSDPVRARLEAIAWIRSKGTVATADIIIDTNQRLVKVHALLRQMREALGITDDKVPHDCSVAVAGKLEHAIAIAEGTSK